MKMSNNPAKYEALIKQYLPSILDISVQFKRTDFSKTYTHMHVSPLAMYTTVKALYL